MKYISTRNKELQISSMQAILQGIAPDGGLYVPESIPAAEISQEELLSYNYNQLTVRILSCLLPDLDPETLQRCVEEGYAGKFETPEPVCLSHADGKDFLELYHGPTCAFKDMALCLLPKLLGASAAATGIADRIVILTATSGDTGKAALEGFADVPGTGIVVFFPRDGVSEVQKLQMVTQKGKNVCVCAVEGNFDDAQTGVKKALTSQSPAGVSYSSANSINIGRLAPQVSYYFFAYKKLVEEGRISFGDPVDFSVPTGNFGDILAGWLAKKMGLPVGRLLCASNKNNVLTDFLRTGVYDRRREFWITSSPSMDILVSSNLERLLFYACGEDAQTVAGYMKDLTEQGFFMVSPRVLSEIRKDFDCAYAEDEEVDGAIRKVWEDASYLMDPHTAVAWVCAEKVFGGAPCVVLSTASPFKFAPAMLTALGKPGAKGLAALDELEELTGLSAPENLKALKEKEILHRSCVSPEEIEAFCRSAAGQFGKEESHD